MKRALLGAAFSWVALSAAPAQAALSIWQRAERPAAANQQLVLNQIERLLRSVDLPELKADLSAGAIALSQLGLEHWPCLAGRVETVQAGSQLEIVLDTRLEYLVGGALLDTEAGRETEARCMLERALRAAPDSPLAAHGWSDLAIASAKLGDRNAEHAAYLRALELTWEPDARGNLLANLAESDMALGDLPRAIRGYRQALRSSSQPELLAGAYFGLAVALDRSGDLPSALAAAKHAVSVQLPLTLFPAGSVLDLPNVFFTPSYELYYYKALGAMATAQLAKSDVARHDALVDAAEEWTRYLLRAEADHAPWAERAALHQASIERQLLELTKKMPKNVARPALGDEASVL